MADDQIRTLSLIVVVSLKLPETPCIVIVNVPVVALLLAVSVRTLVLVAGFVPNDARHARSHAGSRQSDATGEATRGMNRDRAGSVRAARDGNGRR